MRKTKTNKGVNRSQNHSITDKIDTRKQESSRKDESIQKLDNINILHDYEKLSTTYQEYIRGADISTDFDFKGRNRSKKSSRTMLHMCSNSNAKKRISRLQRI